MVSSDLACPAHSQDPVELATPDQHLSSLLTRMRKYWAVLRPLLATSLQDQNSQCWDVEGLRAALDSTGIGVTKSQVCCFACLPHFAPKHIAAR